MEDYSGYSLWIEDRTYNNFIPCNFTQLQQYSNYCLLEFEDEDGNWRPITSDMDLSSAKASMTAQGLLLRYSKNSGMPQQIHPFYNQSISRMPQQMPKQSIQSSSGMPVNPFYNQSIQPVSTPGFIQEENAKKDWKCRTCLTINNPSLNNCPLCGDLKLKK